MVLGSNEGISISTGGGGKRATLNGDAAVKHLSAFGGNILGGGNKYSTYSDFERAAQAAGVYGQFSPTDRLNSMANPAAGLELAAYKSFYGGSADQAGRDYAHAEANKLRHDAWGYNGMGVAPTMTNGAYGSGAYVAVGDRGSGAGGSVGASPKFNYNYSKDPTYLAMLEAYKKNADITSQNTLAHMAAMTGGAPSTYAVQAAQAASDNEMNQLALQIPSLENAAYQKWADQRDFAENQRRYADSLRMDERDAALALDQLMYNRQVSEDDRAYNREMAEREWQYQLEGDANKLEQQKRAQVYEDAYNYYKLTGDPSRLLAYYNAGSDNPYVAALNANQQAKLLGIGVTGSGGSGGSGRKSSGKKGTSSSGSDTTNETTDTKSTVIRDPGDRYESTRNYAYTDGAKNRPLSVIEWEQAKRMNPKGSQALGSSYNEYKLIWNNYAKSDKNLQMLK